MIGIQRGYNGLLNGECFEMNLRSVSNIISAGGTILYTARCLEFKTKEGQDRGAAKCRELGIDALVVIGGDGSYRGARELAHRGIPMIGLPGTIDNDIACTEYTIGYDTAMNTALEMIDKLRDTTQSHDRCSVVEVMGRNAGYIALNVAIASGAMAVLLPEKEFDMQRDILDKIAETQKTGKRHFIIIVAEGVGHAQEIANEIQARTGIDSRATILGHVQRGGSPTLRDRVNASAMGMSMTSPSTLPTVIQSPTEKGLSSRMTMPENRLLALSCAASEMVRPMRPAPATMLPMGKPTSCAPAATPSAMTSTL